MNKTLLRTLLSLLLCLPALLHAEGDKVTLRTSAPVGSQVALAVNEEAIISNALQLDHSGVNAVGNDCNWYKVIRQEVEITGSITMIETTSFKLASLNIEQAPNLEAFFSEERDRGIQTIQEADFSMCPNISKIGIQMAELKQIKLQGLSQLSLLGIGGNNLSALDVSGCNSLSIIFMHRNQIKETEMGAFIASLPSRVGQSNGFVVIIDTHPSVTDEGNVCTAEQVRQARDKNWIIKTANNEEYPGSGYQKHISDETIRLTTALTIGQGDNYIPLGIEAYPDEDFEVEGGTYHSTANGRRYYLLESPNLVIRGKVRSLNCGGTYLTHLDISGNPELESLLCDDNEQLQTLILGNPSKLKRLNTSDSPVGDIDFAVLPALEYLYCRNSQVPSRSLVSLPSLTQLKELNCTGNAWSTLDLSKATQLEKLFAAGCGLLKVDLTHCPNLREVQVHVNYLRELPLASDKLYSVIAFDNEISGEQMTQLVESLPTFEAGADPEAPDQAEFIIFRTDNEPEADKNRCLASDVQIATEKNWTVLSVDMDDNKSLYAGEQGNHISLCPTAAISLYVTPEAVSIEGIPHGETVTLYDLSGVQVYSVAASSSAAVISTDAIPSGVYYLSVGEEIVPLILR
ncbi:leucine-rich repeat domain-containing protein [uncultured Porphyromonas sp.]|uniref:leucine-rich repeat domain-containing protein n=1 Tax=uncultured Porphyromonas sp. TaxID=159274 RepID=UPI0025F4AF76|nr:leucine-rich repeat domain-containing protein [uncultured Porphyromonas sp.]